MTSHLKDQALGPQTIDGCEAGEPTAHRGAYFVLRPLRHLLKGLLIRRLKSLRTHSLESFIGQLVAQRAGSLPADEALRFLFRLDAVFYSLEGRKSIEYDGGLHTKHRHIRYHDFFVKRITAGQQVLDIGCGVGALAYDVAEKAGARVVALDLSPENISIARMRRGHPLIEYRVADALKEIPEASFDVVILSNLLEHLPDRVTFLRRVRAITHASRFLVRVPLFERDWRVPLKRELGIEWRLDPTHETEYTLESFSEEMTAAQMKIIHQEVRWGEIWAEVVPIDSRS
jgi:SAM-dependent methyltransferase